MSDTLPPSARSALMSRIRGRDTKPELAVRSLLHGMGLRFRVCWRDLPGTPDILLPRHGTVIFVHSWFWHRHKRCKGATTPKSNVGFWTAKFEANVARDARNRTELRKMGWSVLTVWECQLRRPEMLQRKFARLLIVR